MVAGVMEMAARSLTGIWLVPAFGFAGAAYGNPLAWLFADVFLVPAYFICRRLLMGGSFSLRIQGKRREMRGVKAEKSKKREKITKKLLTKAGL